MGQGSGLSRGTGILQSVERALRVLDEVSTAPDGLTAKQLARRLGLPLPTVYHLTATLVGNDYLIRLPDRRGYALGPRIGDLARGMHDQLAVPPGIARALHAVHVEARTPAYYAVFRDAAPVIAHVVDSPALPRVRPLDVGFHEATHALAFGKVMLASLPREDREDLLDTVGTPSLTPATVTDRRVLATQMEQVETSGVAVEVDEFRTGLSCLAAPVRTAGGAVVGALAVSTDTPRLRSERWRIEHAVRIGAARCTRVLALG